MFRKGLIILTCMAMIWVNYKMHHSSIYQAYLMYDFNANTLYYPLDMVNKIDNEFPNVTLTALPIKFLQGRYYEDIDSIEIAKKLYFESIDANPYLKAGEAELAGLYYNQKEYDSAYYYAKMAFEQIPNSNVHRSIYFKTLQDRKDTIELRNAFNKIKKFYNQSHWKEYLIRRTNIVGTNDNEVVELLKDYRVKFETRLRNNLDPGNDLEVAVLKSFLKETDILESLLKSGSKNVVLSVELSLEAQKLFDEKKYLLSASLYQMAIELDPTDYTFYENAAIAYNLGEDYEKAKVYFEKVINQFRPNNGKAEFYYGIMLIKLDNTKDGCNNLKKAVDLKFSGQGSIDVYNNFCK